MWIKRNGAGRGSHQNTVDDLPQVVFNSLLLIKPSIPGSLTYPMYVMQNLTRENLYNKITYRDSQGDCTYPVWASTIPHKQEAGPIQRLRMRWVVLAFFSAIALVTGYAGLSLVWEAHYSLRWLVLTAMGSGYILRSVWISLIDNHHPDERHIHTNLGAANYVTILRGLMIAAAFGFLSSPTPPGRLAWAPALLYTLAALCDLLDGYVARLTRNVTQLGETLDMRFDGLGVLIAALLAVQYGKVPAVYLLVGLARYIFLAGIWLRRQMGYKVYNLPASPMRRILAGVQMVFLFTMLWPIITPAVTSILAYFFAVPFLFGFVRDWYIVSGIFQFSQGNKVDALERVF